MSRERVKHEWANTGATAARRGPRLPEGGHGCQKGATAARRGPRLPEGATIKWVVVEVKEPLLVDLRKAPMLA